MARWFRDPLLSAVQLHGASCDRRARFDERASGDETIDAGNRFTFSVEEIGKVCHVRV